MNRSSLLLSLPWLTLAACAGDPTSSGARETSLSFATSNSSSPQLSPRGVSSDITITVGSDVLVLTRVQLVLGEIELKTSSAVRCDNSGPGNDPSCAKIDIGPALVDLPLTAGVRTPLTVAIPPGTYREIEFELEAADDDSGPEAAFLAANPGFRRTSVKVEGTFNGQAFTFTSAVEAEQELHLEPPMVVGGDGTNVTVFVDVSRWFTAAGGIIDPRPANLNATTRAAIEANIRASFQAYRDDDRDGRRG